MTFSKIKNEISVFVCYFLLGNFRKIIQVGSAYMYVSPFQNSQNFTQVTNLTSLQFNDLHAFRFDLLTSVHFLLHDTCVLFPQRCDSYRIHIVRVN